LPTTTREPRGPPRQPSRWRATGRDPPQTTARSPDGRVLELPRMKLRYVLSLGALALSFLLALAALPALAYVVK